jgi:hypothetical protein
VTDNSVETTFDLQAHRAPSDLDHLALEVGGDLDIA